VSAPRVLEIASGAFAHKARLEIRGSGYRVEVTGGGALVLPRLLGLAPERILGRPVSETLGADASEFVKAQLGAFTSFIAPIVRLGVGLTCGSLHAQTPDTVTTYGSCTHILQGSEAD
jgi:hypothetical protein